MSVRTTLTGTATIASLALAPLAPALAQTSEQADPEQMQPAPDMQFDEADLESFADAAMKVMALRQTFDVRLQAAEDEGEQQALVQQAQQEMTAAIEETDGMDVETYTAIGDAAQSNQALSQRVIALIEERMPAEDQQPTDDG